MRRIYKRRRKIKIRRLFLLLIVVMGIVFIKSKITLTRSNNTYLSENVEVYQGDENLDEFKNEIKEMADYDSDYREIAESLDRLPPLMIKTAAMRPEAKGFILGFLKNNPNLAPNSSEFHIDNGLVFLAQWDKDWAYYPYAGGCMGTHGCGPTSISMILYGLGIKQSPVDVADFAERNGHIDNGMTRWSIIDGIADEYGLYMRGDYTSLDQLPKNQGLTLLSMKPGDFTLTGHFVVLVGQNPDGTWRVNDPNSVENSRRAWTTEELSSQIKAMWYFEN